MVSRGPLARETRQVALFLVLNKNLNKYKTKIEKEKTK